MHLRHGIIMAQVHDDLGEATDFGVHLSTSALRGTLRERGLRWGRPRLAMPLKVDPAKVRIPTPGTNGTRALFGALKMRTGRWVYVVRERLRTDDFLAFLAHLLVVYR